MFDNLSASISEFLFETVGAELCTFIVSMIPIIELRGAIPIGQGMGLGFWPCYIISVIGNMLPVPIILLFVRAVLGWMKKVKYLDKIAIWVENKADKHSGKVTKYATWGLFLFVAVPLPGTGAWTGALIAALLNMRMKKALPFIFAGVLAAGLIVSLLSFGIFSILL
ncbi:MAG: small multi-drug export protein [Ruminococcaceae bacterium]|nr:small multi-drug export protein [Oscillospiraceae bacterium]